MSTKSGLNHPTQHKISLRRFRSINKVFKELEKYYNILKQAYKIDRELRVKFYRNVGEALQEIKGYNRITGFSSTQYPYISGITDEISTQLQNILERMRVEKDDLEAFNDQIYLIYSYYINDKCSKYRGNTIKDAATLANIQNEFTSYWLPTYYNFNEYYNSELNELNGIEQLIDILNANRKLIESDEYNWHQPNWMHDKCVR